MHNDTFYLRARGRTIGPFSLDKMRRLAVQAQIGRATDVSLDGGQWSKAGDFPEIFEASSAAEPPTISEAAPDGLGSPSLVSTGTADPWTTSAPGASGQRWHYTQNGETRGPVDLFTLQQLVANGHIAANEHVIPEGGSTWSPVNTMAATQSPPPAFAPLPAPSLQRVPRASTKALVLLTQIIRVCGYLYILGFLTSSAVSLGCLFVVLKTSGRTDASDDLGLWLGAVLFCGIAAVASFSAAELIKLTIRGVHAMEETAFHLRNMQRG